MKKMKETFAQQQLVSFITGLKNTFKGVVPSSRSPISPESTRVYMRECTHSLAFRPTIALIISHVPQGYFVGAFCLTVSYEFALWVMISCIAVVSSSLL